MIWTCYGDYNRAKRKAAKRKRRADWHPFFAVLPCRVGTHKETGSPIMAWLVDIERKCTYYRSEFVGPPHARRWRWGFTSIRYRRKKEV
jgi:hypothetical protein